MEGIRRRAFRDKHGVESTRGKSRADDDQVREKLVGVLSDWHLLAFLDTSGFLDQDDMAALCRLATTHDSGAALDAVLLRPGWQTLMALAREHIPQSGSNEGKSSAPEKDQFTYDGGMDSDDDVGFDDANDEFYDDGEDDDDEVQISAVRHASRNDTSEADAATAAAIAAAQADDAPAGVKVCSHCTYHNESSATDCEICGLPL